MGMDMNMILAPTVKSQQMAVKDNLPPLEDDDDHDDGHDEAVSAVSSETVTETSSEIASETAPA